MGGVYFVLAVLFIWAVVTYWPIAIVVAVAAALIVRYLRGRASQSPTAVTGMMLNLNYFNRIRDDASLEVVGEAYRQELVALAKSPGANDLPPGLPPPPAGYYKAVLVPEPTNKYDPSE